MKFITIAILSILLSACSTTPVKKEPKPDVLIHEDISDTFWYQVWEKENGQKYIKELRKGTITFWD